MNNHSFDDQIRQKASGHEAPVPAGTWEAIAQKKKKRRRYPLFWWITGAAVLSGSIILFVYNNESGSKNKLAAAQETATQHRPANDAPAIAPVTIAVAVPSGATGKEPATFKMISATISSARPSKTIATTEIADPSSAALVTEIKKAGITSNESFLSEANDQQTKNNSFTVIGSGLSNYDPHRPISEFSPQKQLHKNSKLVIKDADSILDRVNAVIAATTKKLSKKNKWTIDISVMPFLPVQQNQSPLYLTRTKTEAMQTAEYKTDRVSTHLQPSLAYTISVTKRINPRLRIGAGLQYSLIKEKVDLAGTETRTTYTEVQRLVNGSSGMELIKDTVANTSTGTLTIDALNSYRFISIPLSVQYRLTERRSWLLQLHAGVLLNISANYHNSIDGKLVQYDNQGMHNNQQKNSIGLDIFAGLRLSKSLRSFSVFAEPTLRYNMKRHDISDMINRKYIHQAGLSLGLSYTLRY